MSLQHRHRHRKVQVYHLIDHIDIVVEAMSNEHFSSDEVPIKTRREEKAHDEREEPGAPGDVHDG